MVIRVYYIYIYIYVRMYVCVHVCERRSNERIRIEDLRKKNLEKKKEKC